jgi:hypothetical protein
MGKTPEASVVRPWIAVVADAHGWNAQQPRAVDHPLVPTRPPDREVGVSINGRRPGARSSRSRRRRLASPSLRRSHVALRRGAIGRLGCLGQARVVAAEHHPTSPPTRAQRGTAFGRIRLAWPTIGFGTDNSFSARSGPIRRGQRSCGSAAEDRRRARAKPALCPAPAHPRAPKPSGTRGHRLSGARGG